MLHIIICEALQLSANWSNFTTYHVEIPGVNNEMLYYLQRNGQIYQTLCICHKPMKVTHKLLDIKYLVNILTNVQLQQDFPQ